MQAPIPLLGEKGGPGLVLYDGVCVLCSGWFRFTAKRDRQRKFLFTAIQSDFGRDLALKFGIDPDNPETNVVLLDGHVYLRSDSALAVLSALPYWRWTAVFRLVPRALRDRFYRSVARNRYRLWGRYETCDLSGGDFADRVIG